MKGLKYFILVLSLQSITLLFAHCLDEDTTLVNLRKLSERGNIFTSEETQSILQLGLQEEIFCNPWEDDAETVSDYWKQGFYDDAFARLLKNQDSPIAKKFQKLASQNFPHTLHSRHFSGQDITARFQYFLHSPSGRIFFKPRHENFYHSFAGGELDPYEGGPIGMRASWWLHDGTGGPTFPFKYSDEKIIGIQAQAEVVSAVTNYDRLFLYKTTKKELPTYWEKHMGQPIRDALYMPKNYRAWSMSVSAGISPGGIRSEEFMDEKDLVAYYEDAIGQKVSFGLTLTIFVLEQNGHYIYYWDTGLPPTFSRAFLTPQNGDFEAINLSVAGSTIFVIGYEKDGSLALYQRMFDYEINGTCPCMIYTYKQPSYVDPEAPPQFFLKAERFLPLPGWKKVDLPKEGKQLTDRISIFTTGQGNCARELRIAGTHREGKLGYFVKNICSENDDFSFVETKKSEGKELNFERQKNAEAIAMNYEGSILFGLLKKYVQSVELRDFHFYQAPDQPSLLRFHFYNGKVLEAKLRTGDAWSMTAQKRRHEEMVGRKGGEPKALLGTLELFDEQKIVTTDGSLLDDDLGHFFKKYHQVTNLFSLIASEERVFLKANHWNRSSDDYMDFKHYSKLEILLERIPQEKQKIVGYFEQMAMDPNLIKGKSSDNLELLHKIEKEHRLMMTQNMRYAFFNSVGATFFPAVSLAASLTNTPKLHPIVGQIAGVGYKLFPNTAKVNLQQLFFTNEDYNKARKILKKRIQENN